MISVYIKGNSGKLVVTGQVLKRGRVTDLRHVLLQASLDQVLNHFDLIPRNILLAATFFRSVLHRQPPALVSQTHGAASTAGTVSNGRSSHGFYAAKARTCLRGQVSNAPGCFPGWV